MSLFDDASLVMIPSAYKDGKLYSIKPTDGSGDFTFTRGSNLAATRVDVNGLIEKGRENLILQSNQFDTTWATNASVTSGQAGYDGSNNAWLLENLTSDNYIFQGISPSGVNTFSIYMKAGNVSWGRIRITGGTAFIVWFNLSAGTIGTQTNNIDAKIESVGNGWYRCSLSFLANSNTLLLVYPAQSDNNNAPLGSNIYIQDAQLEQGLVATDYIETTTTTAQAGILEDMPRLDYSGGASCPSLKLEPQRSNLVTQSEYFGSSNWTKANVTISANATTSPDGYTNADKLVGDAVAGAKVAYEIHSITYGQAFTISSFFKKSEYKLCFIRAGGQTNSPYVIYNLDTQAVVSTSAASSTKIEDYGNGWYRVSLTLNSATSSTCAPNVSFLPDSGYTLSSNIPEYTGDGTSGGFVWGCQLEENGASYASSYIPTYGTSQTRSNDAYINSSIEASLSNGYTAFVEYETLSTSEYNQIQFKGSGGNYLLRIGNQVRVLASSYVANNTSGVNKFALQVESTGNFNLFKNGSSIATGSGVTFDLIEIKNDVSGSNVKQWLVFPTALTDSECIALTS